jgi:hypothetical protein
MLGGNINVLTSELPVSLDNIIPVTGGMEV